jgi:hypothetical protein
MNTKPALRWITAFSRIVGVCGLGWLAYFVTRDLKFSAMAAADVHVEAFTADQTSFGKDGHVIERKITARRRDGSTATLHWFGAMNLPPVR